MLLLEPAVPGALNGHLSGVNKAEAYCDGPPELKDHDGTKDNCLQHLSRSGPNLGQRRGEANGHACLSQHRRSRPFLVALTKVRPSRTEQTSREFARGSEQDIGGAYEADLGQHFDV